MGLTPSRVPAAGRPPLGVPDLGPGRSGWSRSHCSSVKSVGYGFRVMPDTSNRFARTNRDRFQDTLSGNLRPHSDTTLRGLPDWITGRPRCHSNRCRQCGLFRVSYSPTISCELCSQPTLDYSVYQDCLVLTDFLAFLLDSDYREFTINANTCCRMKRMNRIRQSVISSRLVL